MFKLKQLLLLAAALTLGVAPVIAGRPDSDSDSDRRSFKECLQDNKKPVFGGALALGVAQTSAGAGATIAGVVKMVQARMKNRKFYSSYDENGHYVKGLKRLLTSPAEVAAAREAATQKALEVILCGLATAVPGVCGIPGLVVFAREVFGLGKNNLFLSKRRNQENLIGVSIVANLVLAAASGVGLCISEGIENRKVNNHVLAAIKNKGRIYSNKDVFGNKLPRGQKRLVTDRAEYFKLVEARLKDLKRLQLASKVLATTFGASAVQLIANIIGAVAI